MSKPPDKVQLLKEESTTGGGDPFDNDELFVWKPLDPNEDAPEVQGIFLQSTASGVKDENVYITINGFDMIFRDDTVAAEVTLSVLFATASGSGLTALQHKTLRQGIHFIPDGPAEGFASNAYKEIEGGLFPTNITWYESPAKTEKIFETIITRTGGGTLVAPTPIIYKIYDTDGTTVLATITDNIIYDGIAEVSRTRTIV